MKKKETKDGIEYTIEGPTKAAQDLKNEIIKSMAASRVKGDEVLPVLGEAVIEVLITISNIVGDDPMGLIKCFGEAIYTAELALKKKERK